MARPFLDYSFLRLIASLESLLCGCFMSTAMAFVGELCYLCGPKCTDFRPVTLGAKLSADLMGLFIRLLRSIVENVVIYAGGDVFRRSSVMRLSGYVVTKGWAAG